MLASIQGVLKCVARDLDGPRKRSTQSSPCALPSVLSALQLADVETAMRQNRLFGALKQGSEALKQLQKVGGAGVVLRSGGWVVYVGCNSTRHGILALAASLQRWLSMAQELMRRCLPAA